ncbi:MAG: hypothetical protein NTW59_04165 [Candidatus Diapherotrites archaeon]|nr:hypothetical protein [Candidatus Diapherotrites archaeon]
MPEEKAKDAGPEQKARKKAETRKSRAAAKEKKAVSKIAVWAKKEKNTTLIIAVVACIAIALAALAFLGPKGGNIEDFWRQPDGEKDTLRLIIITSQQCPGCEQNNSIEQMFVKNGIQYAPNEIELESADGQSMLASLELMGVKIQKIPSYIIDERSVTNSMLVKTASGSIALLGDVLHYYVNQGKGDYNNSVFVFPELYLDGQQHINIILGQQCGTKGNISIRVFTDPYCTTCIISSSSMENLVDLLGSGTAGDLNVLFRYSYLPTDSVSMQRAIINNQLAKDPNMDVNYAAKITKENVETAATHLACASYVGIREFNLLEKTLYGIYCDQSGDGVADFNELATCNDSNHWGIPLLGEEVMSAVEKAGLKDNILYNACLYTAQETEKAKALAEQWDIDRTPTVVVNCKYEVPPENTITAICKINSDLSVCGG